MNKINTLKANENEYEDQKTSNSPLKLPNCALRNPRASFPPPPKEGPRHPMPYVWRGFGRGQERLLQGRGAQPLAQVQPLWREQTGAPPPPLRKRMRERVVGQMAIIPKGAILFGRRNLVQLLVRLKNG